MTRAGQTTDMWCPFRNPDRRLGCEEFLLFLEAFSFQDFLLYSAKFSSQDGNGCLNVQHAASFAERFILSIPKRFSTSGTNIHDNCDLGCFLQPAG